MKILKDINLMEEKRWRTEEGKEWSILKMEGRPLVVGTRVCFHYAPKYPGKGMSKDVTKLVDKR